MTPRTRWWVATLAALVVVATTASLGQWQTRRAELKTALQAARDEAAAQPPLSFTGGAGEPESLVGRRIRVVGRILPARTIFLDNRTHNGIAGFHVVSPLRIAGDDRVVIVLRGWAPSDPADRSRPPALPPEDGLATIEGLVEPRIATGLALGDWAPGGPDDRVWPRFDPAVYADWSGLAAYDWVLRQTGERSDGLVRDWWRPGDDIDRHRAYALQWYSFSALFAGLWLWYGLIEPRRRRRAGGANGR
jgi:surfeit locus 1 family protein